MYDELVKGLRNNADHYMTVDGEAGLVHLLTDAADAIEELGKRIGFLMNCIYEAEDALDRGADNEWARAALEKAELNGEEIRHVIANLPNIIPKDTDCGNRN